MSINSVRFGDIIDMIDQLPLEQRESLVDVLRQRNAEDERVRVAASIRAAKREHRRGKAKPTTPEDLLREICG